MVLFLDKRIYLLPLRLLKILDLDLELAPPLSWSFNLLSLS
jgi:hypothetical protein